MSDMGHSAENGLSEGAVVAEEWGVHYSPETSDPAKAIRSHGTGCWAKRHAEQEVERTLRNATLPSVGQPMTAVVVHRTVTTYRHETDWTSILPPAEGDA